MQCQYLSKLKKIGIGLTIEKFRHHNSLDVTIKKIKHLYYSLHLNLDKSYKYNDFLFLRDSCFLLEILKINKSLKKKLLLINIFQTRNNKKIYYLFKISNNTCDYIHKKMCQQFHSSKYIII